VSADLALHDECGAVVSTVPPHEVEPALLRMAMSGGFCSETCPHCGDLNTFPGFNSPGFNSPGFNSPGFNSMPAYTCRECGEPVRVERPVVIGLAVALGLFTAGLVVWIGARI
jgi:hypothetical protein